jgi:hypothetical protein
MDFDSLVNDILNNPEIILTKDFTEDQLLEIQKRINPYKSFSINESNESNNSNYKKILVCSYTNLREEYLKKMLMTSLIGFIFQIGNEYEINSNLLKITNVENDLNSIITDLKNDISHLTNELSEKLNTSTNELSEKLTTLSEKLTALSNKLPEKEVQMSEKQGRAIIQSYLHDLFKFDPNKHVRRANIDLHKIQEELKTVGENQISHDPKDPIRPTLNSLLLSNISIQNEHIEEHRIITNSQENYNAVCRILSDKSLMDATLMAINNHEVFSTYLMPLRENSQVIPATEIIPPIDIFYRWSYYNEVNYEEIRKVTEALYVEKPDLDLLIGAWTTFEGTEEKVDAQFHQYCQTHQSEFVSEIKSIDFGNWSIIADVKKNREKVEFYNKNTEVLKRILDRYEEDKKLGSELMKNRIKQKKAKNIEEDGPDDEGIANYSEFTSKNMSGVDRGISREDMLRLEKVNGNIKAAKELEYLDELENNLKKIEDINSIEYYELRQKIEDVKMMINIPDNSVQVDVFVNDTSLENDGGSFTKTSFYTKSEELDKSHTKN